MKLTTQFLEKYNKTGPRYTSYPPATSFKNEFNQDDYVRALIQSNSENPKNISIYIHIPFCPQLCFFCGCNTSAFESAAKIRRYIDCVLKEIDTVTGYLDKTRVVTQIHWGGGTPNSINFDYIEEIITKIRSVFKLSENCEIAIECSPAYLEMEDIDRLSEIGFNRMSLGIQDFSNEVLKAINRRPSKHPLEQVVQRIILNKFKGFNFDLVYGLPLQTVESFRVNIEKAIELSPDRIVTFSYAHVPWVNARQNNIDESTMPSPEDKLNMLLMAYDILTQHGYEAIGMDHFAKPADVLAIAKHKRTIHRNFQGYCTRETTGQVYAFGSSSISQLWGSYAQNIKNLDQYMEAIETTGLATERGYGMSANETVIREVINEIMCNGHLDFKELAERLKIAPDDIKRITAYDPSRLVTFEKDGLLETKGDVIQVSVDGMFIVRNIAMLFDPFLNTQSSHFSKTV